MPLLKTQASIFYQSSHWDGGEIICSNSEAPGLGGDAGIGSEAGPSSRSYNSSRVRRGNKQTVRPNLFLHDRSVGLMGHVSTQDLIAQSQIQAIRRMRLGKVKRVLNGRLTFRGAAGQPP